MKKPLVFLAAFFLITTFTVMSIQTAFAEQDTWVSKTRMNQAKTGFGVASVDGVIYVIGGHPFDSTKVTIDQTSVYDPLTDEWHSKQHMPEPLAWFATAAIGYEIYVIGGAWFLLGSEKNETWVYSVENNDWTPKAATPTARGGMEANVVNEKIYVIGGAGTDGNVLAVNEVYDPATDTWSIKTPIPTPVTAYASAVVDDKIYIIGGLTPSENSPNKSRINLTQIYDPLTDTWSLGAPLPDNQSSISAAATGTMAPKRIYVIGDGLNQIYNPTTDSWTQGTPIPNSKNRLTNFDDAELIAVNDQIYALGGVYENDGASYSINEQYTPIGYGTSEPSTPTPSIPANQAGEPFPTTLVVAVVAVSLAVLIGGLLMYFKKR